MTIFEFSSVTLSWSESSPLNAAPAFEGASISKEIAGKASVDVGDRFEALLGASLNADDSSTRMNSRMPTLKNHPRGPPIYLLHSVMFVEGNGNGPPPTVRQRPFTLGTKS